MSKKAFTIAATPPKGNRTAGAAEAFFDNLPSSGTPGDATAPHAHVRAADAMPAPTPAPAALTSIEPAGAVDEPTQRLTLEIPASLHRAIKIACASRSPKATTIKDEIMALLDKHYPR